MNSLICFVDMFRFINFFYFVVRLVFDNRVACSEQNSKKVNNVRNCGNDDVTDSSVCVFFSLQFYLSNNTNMEKMSAEAYTGLTQNECSDEKRASKNNVDDHGIEIIMYLRTRLIIIIIIQLQGCSSFPIFVSYYSLQTFSSQEEEKQKKCFFHNKI